MNGYRLTRAADADLERIARDTASRWGYKQAEAYLLSLEAAFANLVDFPGIGRPVPEREGYFRVESGSQLDGVEIKDGTLYIAHNRPTAPKAARLLAGRLYGMLPRVRVTEVVSEVAQAIALAACFTHLRRGHPAADVPALLVGLGGSRDVSVSVPTKLFSAADISSPSRSG